MRGVVPKAERTRIGGGKRTEVSGNQGIFRQAVGRSSISRVSHGLCF